MRKTAMERFREKYVVDASGCWLWTACTIGHGYGGFTNEKGKLVPAHRWLYEQLNGPRAAEALDHLCRVRCCVNPSHLEPVSDQENLLRGETLAAENAAKTHCKKGHPLSGDNLYVQPGHKDGHVQRICRVCKNERNRRDLRRRAERLGSWRTPEQRAKDTTAMRNRRAQKKEATLSELNVASSESADG